jgi:type VI secretion system secreted protein Hcp
VRSGEKPDGDKDRLDSLDPAIRRPEEVTMAETVHLFLKANGVNIEGDTAQTGVGRANSIECVFYEQGITTTREAGVMATGRRQYQPLLIRKRIDRSSPLLIKALCENQAIEGTFKFFRPNSTGDGTMQPFYTVAIKQGRIASIKQLVPDTLVAATSSHPPLEEVSFVFNTIEWTFTDGGVTHQDSWSANRG